MYITLDTAKINALHVVRHGWISPEYKLTDNGYSYGKMCYTGLSKRRPVVETANGNWSFVFEGFFRNTVLIRDKDGIQVGKLSREIFSRVNTLIMNNGFTARFHKVELFSRNSVWESDEYGTIMQIDNPLFSFAYPVIIKPNAAPKDIMPLLIFLGVHRIIVNQQKKAAH